MPEPPAPPVVDNEIFVHNGHSTSNYSARCLLDAQRQVGDSSQNSSMANVSRDIGAIAQEASDEFSPALLLRTIYLLPSFCGTVRRQRSKCNDEVKNSPIYINDDFLCKATASIEFALIENS
uniref:Uncharacterized protein n=1 Tax=Romanomermis culicivorax TaxID=13658 RepID=A0A915JQM5_ROMCU